MTWADAIVLALSALAIGLALGGLIGAQCSRDTSRRWWRP